jgi:hypothetical protein
MANKREVALSIKQPWATLVIHGRKQIEIRRWSTARRGRVLIHAGRIADERTEAWAHVPEDLFEFTQMRGGIIGAVDLIDCVAYRSLEQFARDRAQHLNEPSWFEKPVLYGFRIANPTVTPFRRYPGWVRFFDVEG